MESRLAIEYGIISLPTMFLVDGQGKVVNRNLRTAAEVDASSRSCFPRSSRAWRWTIAEASGSGVASSSCRPGERKTASSGRLLADVDHRPPAGQPFPSVA